MAALAHLLKIPGAQAPPPGWHLLTTPQGFPLTRGSPGRMRLAKDVGQATPWGR